MYLLPILIAAALAGGQTSANHGGSQADPASSVAPVEPGTISGLHLPVEDAAHLQSALDQKDYRTAQQLLLTKVESAQQAGQRRSLLLLLGSVYFLSHDSMQAAIAWQKAGKLGPLPDDIRFSLAMAYIQIRRSDWATAELKALHTVQPAKALYPFWLGRLAYDRQRYTEAADWFRIAIAAEPRSSRSHDNLGLCLFDMNDVDGAIIEYQRAISLQQSTPGASGWPFLNLGIAEEFRGHMEQAVKAFQEAIELSPKFAPPHYHLGNIYASSERVGEATKELETATAIDPGYPEPHAVLARLYRRQGDLQRSQKEVLLYRQLLQKLTPEPTR